MFLRTGCMLFAVACRVMRLHNTFLGKCSVASKYGATGFVCFPDREMILNDVRRCFGIEKLVGKMIFRMFFK